MKNKYAIIAAATCLAILLFSACGKPEKTEPITQSETIENTAEESDKSIDSADSYSQEYKDNKAAGQTSISEENEDNKAPNTTENKTDNKELIGMPNPMKEINSSEEFEKALGIKILAENIDKDAKMFIINGKVAEAAWHTENVNGDDVEFTLRATKDAETAEMLHGIYDENMSEEIVNNVALTEDKSIEIHFKKAETEKYGIYTFNDGNIYYSLTYGNDMSQMALAEILDRVMMATGIMYHKEIVQALPVSNEITDGIYPAQFEKDWVYHVDDKYLMECSLYAEEYFDAVEVNLLREGDSIVLDGDMVYEISSLEKKDNGEIAIYSDASGEEFMLTPGDGGTYKVRGYDDMCSYSFVASGKFNISKNVKLVDTSDIENGCQEEVIEGAEKVYDYIQNNEKLHLSYYSTTVRLEGKLIKEIDVRYVP